MVAGTPVPYCFNQGLSNAMGVSCGKGEWVDLTISGVILPCGVAAVNPQGQVRPNP
jgi:hypothetical protein